MCAPTNEVDIMAFSFEEVYNSIILLHTMNTKGNSQVQIVGQRKSNLIFARLVHTRS